MVATADEQDPKGSDDRIALGATGEEIAWRYLAARGLQLIARNWRCAPIGEIDLVLRDGADLVICEVKTRRGTAFGAPIEAVTPRKLARLRRLAGAWLREHPGGGWSGIRLDVVGVLAHPDGTYAIDHRAGVGG
ncbi:YraN family protein [Janibacter sp. GXQ6167]|uniref:YraN family protein n=1 Tax=Janibacter sp. GXQ6167 TaxID=3240791 RepID=UPI003523223B